MTVDSVDTDTDGSGSPRGRGGGLPESLDADYRRFRPMLLSALGQLARRGYKTQPSDGLELVHDFFIASWGGLRRRYDPERGAFSTYVYGAFIRFARARIIRDHRFRAMLRPADALAELSDTQGYAPGVAQDEAFDAGAVRQALEGLLSEDRQILKARFFEGQSERLAARSLGMSRYGFRQRTVEALGRLAVAMDERGAMSAADWRIARALWAENRSLTDAARSLRMPDAQARLALKRIFSTLAVGLKGAS